VIAQADERDTEGFEVCQRVYQMAERTPEANELPYHHLELAPASVRHEPVQRRA
jgi:hypothetical protein